MSELVNFIVMNTIWWMFGVGVSFFLMVAAGLSWESSGKTGAARKEWLLVTAKAFAVLLSLSSLTFVLSLVILFWRAVFRG